MTLLTKNTTEAAFETAIEASLLAGGCVALPEAGYDAEQAFWPLLGFSA